jgi:hypothetical protein
VVVVVRGDRDTGRAAAALGEQCAQLGVAAGVVTDLADVE